MLKKILCVLSLPLFLVACGEDEKKQATSDKKLIMVTSGDYPPFEFFSTAEGASELVGFDIDVAKRLAEYLGYELEIRDIDYASIIPALKSGRASFAMAGINPTEERAKSVDFSQPYYFMNNVLIHRLDNDFIRRHDYEGVKITVLLGSTQEQFAKVWAESHPGVKIIPMNRTGDAIQEVIVGRADGAILDETPAMAYVHKNTTKLTVKTLEGESYGNVIAFPKGSPLVEDFNRALAHLRDIGALDEIIKKWLAQT